MITTTLIQIPQWGRLTLLEGVWLGSGLMALGFSAAHLPQLTRDYIVSLQTGRRVLQIVAWGYVRRELFRFLQGACLTVIGAYAALLENPIPGPAKVSIVGLVLTSVLFLLAFLVSAQSFFDWRTRTETQRLIAEENGIP